MNYSKKVRCGRNGWFRIFSGGSKKNITGSQKQISLHCQQDQRWSQLPRSDGKSLVLRNPDCNCVAANNDSYSAYQEQYCRKYLVRNVPLFMKHPAKYHTQLICEIARTRRPYCIISSNCCRHFHIAPQCDQYQYISGYHPHRSSKIVLCLKQKRAGDQSA